jgi:hypothetical protein
MPARSKNRTPPEQARRVTRGQGHRSQSQYRPGTGSRFPSRCAVHSRCPPDARRNATWAALPRLRGHRPQAREAFHQIVSQRSSHGEGQRPRPKARSHQIASFRFPSLLDAPPFPRAPRLISDLPARILSPSSPHNFFRALEMPRQNNDYSSKKTTITRLLVGGTGLFLLLARVIFWSDLSLRS